MLKKLTTWLITVVFIFQTFVLVSPVQAAPISPLNSTLLATLSNNSEVDHIEFSDTKKFYQKLADALKSKKEVKISTNYKSYADLPPELKNSFKLDEADVRFLEKTDIPSSFVGAATTMPTTINSSEHIGKIGALNKNIWDKVPGFVKEMVANCRPQAIMTLGITGITITIQPICSSQQTS